MEGLLCKMVVAWPSARPIRRSGIAGDVERFPGLGIGQEYLDQLQQFGKPTWHPYNFGKTRKNGLQQFGKPT
jgi:hypothetical protein